VTSLRAFQRRLAHGKVGFAQSSVLGLLAGGAHQSLLQLLATT